MKKRVKAWVSITTRGDVIRSLDWIFVGNGPTTRVSFQDRCVPCVIEYDDGKPGPRGGRKVRR